MKRGADSRSGRWTAGRSGTGNRLLKELEGAAGNRLLVREDDCLHVIDLGSAFRTAAFGCATTWTYHDPNGGHGASIVFRPEAVLSPDGTWMMVDGVAVDIATLTRHATLMPAGTHDPNPVMFPLGPKQLLVKVYDSTYHTIAAVVCDLPAGALPEGPEYRSSAPSGDARGPCSRRGCPAAAPRRARPRALLLWSRA